MNGYGSQGQLRNWKVQTCGYLHFIKFLRVPTAYGERTLKKKWANPRKFSCLPPPTSIITVQYTWEMRKPLFDRLLSIDPFHVSTILRSRKSNLGKILLWWTETAINIMFAFPFALIAKKNKKTYIVSMTFQKEAKI